jgi:sulfur carrier protein ThiS
MDIFIDRDGKTIKVKFTGQVRMLLKKLDILAETVIVTREDDLLTEDDKVYDKDKIRILSVVSGG